MGRVSLDTLLHRSKKNMGSGMNAIVKKSALEVIRRAYKEGINAQLSSGMRTMTEQAALYGKGRKLYVYKGKDYGKPSLAKVTNAKPGYSNHNFGLAVDYFLTSEDGTKAIWVVNAKWKRVAAIAKTLGFAWGGDWISFKDNPHLEMTGGLSTAQLRAGKRPKLTDRTGTKTSSKPVQSSGGSYNIKEAQKYANSRDYPTKATFTKLTVDGYKGPKTLNALLRIYQYYGKVAIDGIFGSKSKAAGSIQSRTKHTPGWTRLIQSLLNVHGSKLAVDGIFGSGTESALKSFQKSKGIAVDGVAGPNTYEKFFK